MKKIFDFFLALFLILILSPLMLITSILIIIDSGFPVFFVQKRVTKNMRIFKIIKFRTMYNDFDKDKTGIQIKGSSKGITRIGRYLRKYKIDEIPQLFNIIFGDMSFVGPRPELPRRLMYYTEDLKANFSVHAGITSLASILFSNEEYLMENINNPEVFYIDKLLPLKAKINIYQISKNSLFFDLQLFFFTFFKHKLLFNLIRYMKDPKIIEEYLNLKNK